METNFDFQAEFQKIQEERRKPFRAEAAKKMALAAKKRKRDIAEAEGFLRERLKSDVLMEAHRKGEQVVVCSRTNYRPFGPPVGPARSAIDGVLKEFGLSEYFTPRAREIHGAGAAGMSPCHGEELVLIPVR